MELETDQKNEGSFIEYERVNNAIEIKAGVSSVDFNVFGMSTDDLYRIEEDDEGTLEIGDKYFEYDDSDEYTYENEFTGEKEQVYVWDFISSESIPRINKWESYPAKLWKKHGIFLNFLIFRLQLA